MSLEDALRKVTSEHTGKIAYIYCRISTARGVKVNIVGKQRQSDVDKLALQLGWPNENIRIVDEDHARSGTTTDGRYGYIDMLNDVIDGRVGAVFSLETARVGRDTADWHILIKMCGITETLVIDPDGIYDANDGNDLMMMSVKALMVATELRWITNRLIGAKRVLAKKGELRFFLPVGFVYDENKKVILDTAEGIEEIVRLVFTLFKKLGSAHAVVKYFKENNLKFPTPIRGGPRGGDYDWRPVRHSRVVALLHNPVYAGAYVYGRSKAKQKVVRNEGTSPVVKKYQQKLNREEWEIVLYDVHPGYITWAEFLENEQRLKDNQNKPREGFRGAVRSGSALLQRMVFCGKCGQQMRATYTNNPSIPFYICNKAQIEFKEKICQSMTGDRIDLAVEQLFLEAVQPAQIEMSLGILENVEEEHRKNDRQLALSIKKAERAATEAEERFFAIDPKNKYVFTCAEEDLEKKQKEVIRLKREQAEKRPFTIESLAIEERQQILMLAQDLPQIWRARTTDMVTRKNLLRCLVKDVTITRDGLIASVGVRWRTGAHTVLTVELPGRSSRHRLPARVLEFIKKLAAEKYTNRQIAHALNEAEILNGLGKPFTKKGVKRIRERYRIMKHPLDCSPDQRDDGRYNVNAVARMLDVHPTTVERWCREGRVDGVKGGPGKGWWVKIPSEGLEEFKSGIRRWPSKGGNKTDAAGLIAPTILHKNESPAAPKGIAR
jgi:DNA invertase Pin-like site-specific DNA recombinase